MKQLVPLMILLAFVIAVPHTPAQTSADTQLVSAIAKIKAIDNHAHPLRYVATGEKPDDEYDALPFEAIAPVPLPVRLNPGNLEFVMELAQRVLRGNAIKLYGLPK